MEAASTSETLVNFYQTTQHNKPEENDLHSHHCENLKSHSFIIYCHQMHIDKDECTEHRYLHTQIFSQKQFSNHHFLEKVPEVISWAINVVSLYEKFVRILRYFFYNLLIHSVS
jgi:hypothetical protein